MLVESFKLPVVLLFDFADPEADLIGVTLVAFVRMAGGGGPVIGLEVRREIAENAHRDFADLPAKFRRHVKNKQAVYPRLIARDDNRRDRIVAGTGIPGEEGIKGVSFAGVVVKGRRDLEVNVF